MSWEAVVVGMGAVVTTAAIRAVLTFLGHTRKSRVYREAQRLLADETVKTAQMFARKYGYQGPVDGIIGPHLQAALGRARAAGDLPKAA